MFDKSISRIPCFFSWTRRGENMFSATSNTTVLVQGLHFECLVAQKFCLRWLSLPNSQTSRLQHVKIAAKLKRSNNFRMIWGRRNLQWPPNNIWIEESDDDVISGLEISTTAGINVPPLPTTAKALITSNLLQINVKFYGTRNRKPWSFYRILIEKPWCTVRLWCYFRFQMPPSSRIR